MAKDQRFEIVYSQGTITVTEIWVDKETGVNYLYHASGYSGGLTPLLDREGKPVISPIMNSSRSRSHDRNLKTGPHYPRKAHLCRCQSLYSPRQS